MSIWANHGSNIFGVPNNLHLTEFIASLRDPCPQRMTSLTAILNPTAFTITQVEASNGIHRTKCWCQCSHQLSKREWVDWVKGHCKKETTRKSTLSYSSGHKQFCSCKFHVCDAVFVNTSQEATEEARQPNVLKHREDPGVIDTGICSGEVSQKDT